MSEERIQWPRALGELAAGLENGQVLRQDEIAEKLFDIIEQLPELERQAAKLALLIRRVNHAESVERVENLLTEGMKYRLVLILNKEETREAKVTMPGLLVFIGADVWAPADRNNRAHQALIVNARRTMGRLKAEAGDRA